jgi:hypothetical protein
MQEVSIRHRRFLKQLGFSPARSAAQRSGHLLAQSGSPNQSFKRTPCGKPQLAA